MPPTHCGASSSPKRSASIVRDPETAERLIPKDHLYAGKRPPFVTGYYEAYNNPKVSLVDLGRRRWCVSPRRDRDDRRYAGVRHHRVGNGLRLRHRRADPYGDPWPARSPLDRLLGGRSEDLPRRPDHRLSELLLPGGPHAAAGNNPRYNGDQVDFVTDTLVYLRDHGYDTIEVDPAAEERWTTMIDTGAAQSPFGESSYFFGTNIPGKPRRYLLNSGGRPKLLKEIQKGRDNDYEAFRLSRSSTPAKAKV